MPSCSAARMIKVPAGTVISFPSIVSVTSFGAGGPPLGISTPVPRATGLADRPPVSPGSRSYGRRLLVLLAERAPAESHVLLELLAEVLQARIDDRGRAV